MKIMFFINKNKSFHRLSQDYNPWQVLLISILISKE